MPCRYTARSGLSEANQNVSARLRSWSNNTGSHAKSPANPVLGLRTLGHQRPSILTAAPPRQNAITLIVRFDPAAHKALLVVPGPCVGRDFHIRTRARGPMHVNSVDRRAGPHNSFQSIATRPTASDWRADIGADWRKGTPRLCGASSK